MIQEALTNNKIEFFQENGEIYFLQNGIVKHFNDVPYKILDHIESEMKINGANAELDKMHIYDRIDRIKKYIECNYSIFDNKPDITDNSADNREFVNCNKTHICKHYGKLCKRINGLTQREIDVIRLILLDIPDKQVAMNLGISYFTATTIRQNITKKLGVNSKVGICKFAIINNII